MNRRAVRTLALCLSLSLLVTVAGRAAGPARGPSTPEERRKALDLVKVTETEPWSDGARDARAWLMKFLEEGPDITVKQCYALLGSPQDRAGVPQDLQEQILFSGLGYLLQNPKAGAGNTETLVGALEGTLRAYQAGRAHGAPAVARLDTILGIQKDEGTVANYVRAMGRMCR
jgi:hypothetical protein